MKHYLYDMIGADLECGVKMHPQEDVQRLGIKWVKSEPFPIADCWIFRVEEEVKDPPPYLKLIKDDFKFSDELV